MITERATIIAFLVALARALQNFVDLGRTLISMRSC